MDRLAEDLETYLPQAFESEQYQREVAELQEDLQQRQAEVLQSLKARAEERSFTILQTGQGLLLAPLVNGEVVNPEIYSKLNPQQQEQIEKTHSELQEEFHESMHKMQVLQQEVKEKLHQLDRQAVKFVVGSRIEFIKLKYAGLGEVTHFLDRVLDDLLENVPAYKRARQAA